MQTSVQLQTVLCCGTRKFGSTGVRKYGSTARLLVHAMPCERFVVCDVFPLRVGVLVWAKYMTQQQYTCTSVYVQAEYSHTTNYTGHNPHLSTPP